MRECITNWAPSVPCSLWGRWRPWEFTSMTSCHLVLMGERNGVTWFIPLWIKAIVAPPGLFLPQVWFPSCLNIVTMTMFWLRYYQILHLVNLVGQPSEIPVINELIFSCRRGSRQIKFALKWETVWHVFSTKFNLMQQGSHTKRL